LNFLVTKILPENLAADSQLVHFEKALYKLQTGRNKKLILLKAAKGFGKTGVLSLFVNTFEIPYSFYKIDDEEENLYTLLNYLVQSIDKALPGFADEMKELLEFYKPAFVKNEIINKTGIINFTKALINSLYLFAKKDFFIIIDDSEHIAGYTWASTFLDYLIENSPKNVHFVIVSSHNFPLDDKKFRLKRNLIELDNDDLRVDVKMLRKLAKDIYSLNLSNDRLNYIIEKTEGWITGVHIMLQSMSNDVEAPDNSSLNETMFYFFEKEIIEGMDEKHVKALILSSLFESFDQKLLINLCREVSISYLMELLSLKYNFILKMSTDGNYEYLTFFKEFLQSKVPFHFDGKTISSTYTAAGNYYIEQNDKLKAIKFFSQAGDFHKLIPLVLDNIPELIKAGDLYVIDKWLKIIPDDFAEMYPLLQYYKGIVFKNFYSDYANALISFEITSHPKTKIDEEYAIKSVCHIAEIKFNTGENQYAINFLEKYKSKIKTKKLLPHLLVRLSSFYFQCRDFDKSYIYGKEALDILSLSKQSENISLRGNILNTLGNIYFIKADFTESRIYYQKSLKDLSNLHSKIQTQINYCYSTYYTGDFLNPDTDIKRLLSNKIVNQIPELKVQAAELLVSFFLESGNLKECQKYVDEMIQVCREFDNKVGLVSALVIKCKIYYYENDLAALKKTQSGIQKLKAFGLENDLICADLFGAVLAGSRQKMEKIYEYYEKNNIVIDKIYTSFRLADAAANKKDELNFLKFFTTAINESFRVQYFNCLILEFIKKRKLFDYALELGFDKDSITEIYSEIVSRIETHKLDLKEIELNDITLVSSGIPSLYIRGEKIDDKKWSRSKFKEIFLYLFINRKNYVTKDTLIDEFYPDSDQSYSDNIFHQFLSNLRTIWKSYGNKEYVNYENKMFSFDERYIYGSDIEKLKHYGKKQSPLNENDSEKEALLKKALKLYDDIFMKGYYSSWVEDLRSEISSDKMRLAKELIKILKNKNQIEDVIVYYNILLQEDELNEELHLEVISSYASLGEINTAKLKYKGMLDKFEKELGEKPSAQFLKSIKEVLLQ
jgi:ATP/maltotriose-dependent transcriptional regulator MalT/two-component SAPR family response regulator